MYNALEATVHDILSQFGDVITSDSNIVRKFGKCTYGTDHVIVLDKEIITIQDKWEVTTPCIRDINHFIQSTNNIVEASGKQLKYAIFASKLPMTRNGLDILEKENKNYSLNVYKDIHNSISVDALANDIKVFLFPDTRTQTKESIKLYEHQQDALDTFTKKIKENSKLSAIVSHPTGSGKTITALHMIDAYWNIYPHKVLWITERIDILQSQFENAKYLPSCNLVRWYNKRPKHIPDLDGDRVLLVTNIDSIMSNYLYTKLEGFGLVILDECHSSGAECTSDMLRHFKDNCSIIGFSATPIRPEDNKFKNTAEIFGDGNNINFISRLTMIDMVDRNIIVLPKFYWIEVSSNGDALECDETLHKVSEVLNESTTHKVIAWCKTIERADKWYSKISRYFDKYKVFISHTGKDNRDLDTFLTRDSYAILVCVGRCKEGFDDPKVDVGINLDPVVKRGIVSFIQQTGRTVRKYGNKQYGIMMDTFTLLDKETKIKQICNGIIGYCIFLLAADKECVNTYVDMLNNVYVDKDNNRVVLCTPNKNEINFVIDSFTLQHVDWKDMSVSIKDSINNEFFVNGISYENARKLLAENGIMTKDAYHEFRKTHEILPEDPELAFKGKFLGWIHFLSIPNTYYTLDECKQLTKEYVTSLENPRKYFYEMDKICDALCERDPKFPPSSMWCCYYNVGSIDQIVYMPRRKQKSILDILAE